jgi:translation initiation factor IF-2
MRVYEMAKEFGVPSKTVLSRLSSMGLTIRSAAAPLDDQIVAALRGEVHKPLLSAQVAGEVDLKRCACCDLMQRANPDQFGIQSPVCRSCQSHQGEDAKLKRAEKHVELLRERMDDAGKAAQKAYRDRDLYKEKMRHAFTSRDRAARYLAQINDQHQMRGDGVCSCGKRECTTAKTVYESWPQEMIRRHDAAEREREAEIGRIARSAGR